MSYSKGYVNRSLRKGETEGKEFQREGRACAKALWQQGIYLKNFKRGKVLTAGADAEVKPQGKVGVGLARDGILLITAIGSH